METFGKRLRYLRKINNISQEKLANDLFIDKSTIAKYETDKIDPSMAMIINLAKYFNVTTDFILGLTEF